jgi:hypothetical protein
MPVAEPPTAKRYPMRVITFARRLHEQNGWSAHRIRKVLGERGYHPAHSTVIGWISEDSRAARLERSRLYRRRNGRGIHRGPKRIELWEQRLARMREMRRAGLSFRAIAAMAKLDFDGLDLTEDQVRYMLNGETRPRRIKRLLGLEGSA